MPGHPAAHHTLQYQQPEQPECHPGRRQLSNRRGGGGGGGWCPGGGGVRGGGQRLVHRRSSEAACAGLHIQLSWGLLQPPTHCGHVQLQELEEPAAGVLPEMPQVRAQQSLAGLGLRFPDRQ